MSTSPLVSFQISSAVVRSWIAGLDGLSNWLGITEPGMVARNSLAFSIAPRMPFSRGVSSTCAPMQRQHLAPLDRHRFRHGEDQLVAARGRHEGKADAGVARGRLDQRRLARLDAAVILHVDDHAERDAVLHARQRIEEFQLQEEVGDDALLFREAPHADQRRIADGVEDALVDAALAGRIELHGRRLGGHRLKSSWTSSIGEAI